MKKVIGLVAVGALVAFLRRRGSEAGRLAREASARVQALKQKATRRGDEPKDFNDPTLKAKVETELFRDEHVPKGQINVQARDGVVELRGEVQPELIEELVQRARAVEGVTEVENLLHTPGTPAPAHGSSGS
jgi:osmotically-inducible protein OsmY